MGSDIKSFTVQELVDQGILAKPLDGNHGEIHPKSADFVETGIPFVMASDLKDGAVDLQGCKNISKVQAQTLRKGFAKEGDVLLSHKATIGRTAIVDKIKTEYIVLTPQVTYYRVLDKHRLNPKYLKYYFDSTEFQNLFVQWAGGGSTRLYLGITGQLKLPVYLPDIKNQNQIVTLIDDYNIKLTINRQTNQTLEQMAQALFKSWFVDFDPVIDNALAAGKPIPEELQARAQRRQQQLAKPDHQPLPDDVRQLFPSEFEETEELGWVPKGWEASGIGVFIKFSNGKSTKSSDDGTYPLYGANGIIGLTDEARFQNAVIIGRVGAYCGAIEYCPGKFWASDNTIVATSKNTEKMIPFILYLLKFLELNQFAGGAAQPLLNQTTLNSIKISVPELCICKVFNTIVSGFLSKIEALKDENVSLTKLRDTLLPKLISGELRLPESILESETNPPAETAYE